MENKDTIENLVNSVVKGFDSAENVTTRVELDKENEESLKLLEKWANNL